MADMKKVYDDLIIINLYLAPREKKRGDPYYIFFKFLSRPRYAQDSQLCSAFFCFNKETFVEI